MDSTGRKGVNLEVASNRPNLVFDTAQVYGLNSSV